MKPTTATDPDEITRIHKVLHHNARQLWDMQKQRIAAANRLAAMEREGFDEKDLKGAQAIVEGLEGLEHGIELVILRNVREHPLAPWIKEQRGIGMVTFANLLGVTGDVGRFPTVSKLWKMLGLHVTPDGTAPKKVKGQGWTHTDCQHLHLMTCPKTCTTEHHPNCAPGVLGTAYSPKGRTICYMLGEAIVKVGGDGPYRAAYDVKKAYYEAQRPDWPQVRRHRAAMRFAVKLLVKELWIAWHKLLKPERLIEWEERERERAAKNRVISSAWVPPAPEARYDYALPVGAR